MENLGSRVLVQFTFELHVITGQVVESLNQQTLQSVV